VLVAVANTPIMRHPHRPKVGRLRRSPRCRGSAVFKTYRDVCIQVREATQLQQGLFCSFLFGHVESDVGLLGSPGRATASAGVPARRRKLFVGLTRSLRGYAEVCQTIGSKSHRKIFEGSNVKVTLVVLVTWKHRR
jgi:hypothetical protein